MNKTGALTDKGTYKKAIIDREEFGVPIKVETNGSGGAKNVLTKEDIEKAECIIVAADKNVEMNRFSGKRLIKTKVADGIHKPQELIERAIKGDELVIEYVKK